MDDYNITTKDDISSVSATHAAKPSRKLRRSKPAPMALEQRMMFDGAAVTTAVVAEASVAAAVTESAEAPKQAVETMPVVAPSGTSQTEKINPIVTEAENGEGDNIGADAQIITLELLFVDSGVQDIESLLAGVKEGVEVIMLSADQNPWVQMTEVISRYDNISAIHLLSHGVQGEIMLGDKAYDEAAVQANADYLATWQSHMTADANIMIYGCDIAAGENGQSLIASIARITAADVAASTDKTGTAIAGGDWVLEAQSGITETSLFAKQSALDGYDYLLAPPAGDTTAPTITLTTSTFTSASSSATVQTNEAGTVYLVRSDVTVSNLASITGASGDKWKSLAIDNSAKGKDATFSLTGLSDGTYKAYAVDAAGNLSVASSGSILIDTLAPSTTISTVTFSADTAGGTGTNTDFITKTVSQIISGTLSANLLAGESVQISLDNGSTWTTATATVGSNAYTLGGVTLAASDTLKVRVVDTAGNAGSVKTQAYILDTTIASPTVALSTDTGTSGSDKITNTATLNITGVETGATVEYSTNGTDGWSSTLPALTQGANTIFVRQVDIAGNTSASTSITFTYDTSAASAPAVSLTNDSGVSGSDKITNTGTLNVTGVEEGATVEYSANGVNGWRTTAPSLAQGSNTVYVRQTDKAGNVSSSTSLTFTYDNAVSAPAVALNSDTGASGSDAITSIGTLNITGTEVGATVEYSADGVNGWSTAVPSLLVGANTLYVRQTDVAGNVSAALRYSFVFDTTAPNAPVISQLSDNTNPVQGNVQSGGLTNDTTPTVRVSLLNTNAVAGDSVRLYDGSEALGSAVTLLQNDINNGYKDITLSSLSDKTYALKATVSDVAGNTSTSSGEYGFTVDTTAPAFTSDGYASAVNGQNILYAAAASDATYTGATLSWRLSGRDADLLQISSDGLVTLKTGNLDRTVKSTYSFSVDATDALLNTTTLAVSINVEVPFDGMLVFAGSAIAGSSSTVYFSSISDVNGPSFTDSNGKVTANAFTYQWQKQDANGKWINIPSGQGGTVESYTFKDADLGASYRVVATASSGSGGDKVVKTYTSETLVVGSSVTTGATFAAGSGYIAFDAAYGGSLVSSTGNDNQANYFDLTDDGDERTSIAFYANSATLHNADVGNNIGGYLVYTDADGKVVTIEGTLSRVYKTKGNEIQAVYFLEDGENPATRRAFLLDLDGSKGTDFSQDLLYKTSSDPIKKLFQAFDAELAVSDVTVEEDAGSYAVFDITGEPRTKLQLEVTEGTGDGYADLGDYKIQYLTNGNKWVDYDHSLGAQLDAQGALKVRISIDAENDNVREISETFQLTATAAFDVGADTGTATITDNDPTITVTGNMNVSEGSVAVFTVEISDAQASDKEITLALGGLQDTASASDYSSSMVAFYVDASEETHALTITNGKISLPAGVTRFFVRVNTTDDNSSPVYEGPETFTLSASISERYSDADIATILDNGKGIVYNNDGTENTEATPDDDTPSIYVLGSVVGEGAGYAYFTVGLGQASATDTEIKLTLQDGSAKADEDYAQLEVWDAAQEKWVLYSESVTVEAGETSLRVRASIVDDLNVETAEQFTLTAEVTQGAYVGDEGSGAATIIDNDSNDQIAISINDVTYNEAAGTATFTVTLSGATLNTISVDYATEDDTANSVSDYISKTGTLTFQPGETSKTITITIVNDDPAKVYEGLETFKVLLSNIVVQGGYDQTFNLASDTGPLTSGNSQTLVIDVDESLADAVQYGVGSITLTTDFQTSPFPKSGLPITLEESVAAVGFANEQVSVYVQVDAYRFTLLDSGADNWSYNPATGLLEAKVDFSQATAIIDSETVSLDAYLKENPSATWTFVYDDEAGGPEQARFVSFQIKVGDDRLVILDHNPGIGGIVDDGTGLGGTDDDTPSIYVLGSVVGEGAGYAYFTVGLGQASATDTEIKLTLQDGSAKADEDYAQLEVWDAAQEKWVLYSESVTVEAGETSLRVRASIVDDLNVETAEQFTLTAEVTQGAYVGDEGSGAATIIDNDSNDQIAISINDVTYNEAAGTATFTVTLSGATLNTISVDYATEDDTANSVSDYISKTGTLTFQPGETSKTITITIVNDDPAKVYEGLETFKVLLSNIVVQGGYDQTFNLASDTGPLTSGNSQTLVIDVDESLADAVQYGVGSITLTTDFQTSPFPKSGLPITLEESVAAVGFANEQVSVYVQVDAYRFTLLDSGADNWSYNPATGLLEAKVDFSQATAIIDSETVSLDAYLKENPSATWTFVYDDEAGGPEQARFVSFQIKVGDDRLVILDHNPGIGGIVDDGTGLGGTDDDRTLLISDVLVNEASPYAVFKISGAEGSWLSLYLTDGPGTDADDSQARFGEDYGSGENVFPGIEVYNGTTWVAYEAGSRIQVPDGATLLLARVAIINETHYEGEHQFYLHANSYTAETGDSQITFARGTGIILDDGRGAIFNDSGEENRNAAKDDDRTLKIDSPIVNEGSDYVVFTITGEEGNLLLALDIDSGEGYADISAEIDSLKNIEVWNGSGWVVYDGTNAVIPAGETTLLVRVQIIAEQDDPYEGSETFKLIATQNSQTSVGVATIRDDGTGAYWIGDSPVKATPQELRQEDVRLDDDLDKDGIAPTTETALADLAASQGIGSGLKGDFNGDGIQDAEQNGLATLAWTNVDAFNQANDGTLTNVKPIITISIVDSATGETVSSANQLLDIEVVDYDDPEAFPDALGAVTNANGINTVTMADGSTATTPWDPIRFAVESQTIDGLLTDLDGNADNGTQIRIVIDISAAGFDEGSFTAYLKYASQEAVDAGIYDLDGNQITQAGWYDFTQRTDGGDGAKFISEGGKIVAIELIITDNAFGDNDMETGRIFDPGMPVSRIVVPNRDEVKPLPPPALPALESRRYDMESIQVGVTGPDAQFIYDSGLRVAVASDRDASQRWFRTSLDDDAINCDVATPMWDALESSMDGKLTSGADKAFRVVVTECDAHTLAVFRGVQDHNFELNEELQFALAPDAFVHTDLMAVVKLQATLVNGKALPSWLVFDSTTGKFSGKAPAMSPDVLAVRVIARDQNGREAAVVFRINLRDKQMIANTGRDGFGDQMRMASRDMLGKRVATQTAADSRFGVR